ncbi:MAG: mechanosensitive ion channel family protein [Nanoarchaeota archaeon]
MVLETIPGLSEAILSQSFFGNTIENYIIAGLIFIVAFFGGKFIEGSVVRRLKKMSKKTKTDLDDIAIEVAESFTWFFYVSLAGYFALKFLTFSAGIDRFLNYAIMVIATFYVIRGVQVVIDHMLKDYMKKKVASSESLMRFVGLFAKILLWIIAFLLILSNLGYDVTSLLAGLGIGGLAIALALQSIFDDIFSSLSIFFDKPFEEGDFIIIDNYMGTVKAIGLKTTRLESLWGQEIVISNKDLTSTRINNYKKMQKRRIHFQIGVTYQTPADKLKKINEIVKDIFDSVDIIDLDRVHFKEFGDSALVYEIAYYVQSADYNEYMNAQQEINLQLVKRFQKEGIDFAYPTQTIFLEK